jgi:hypothetical protein
LSLIAESVSEAWFLTAFDNVLLGEFQMGEDIGKRSSSAFSLWVVTCIMEKNGGKKLNCMKG